VAATAAAVRAAFASLRGRSAAELVAQRRARFRHMGRMLESTA
jgi:hypothetical protein